MVYLNHVHETQPCMRNQQSFTYQTNSVFYGTYASLPHLQQPATAFYTNPDEFIHALMPHFFKTHSNIILKSTHTPCNSLFPSGSPTKILCTFPAYYMPHTSHPHLHLTLSRSICRFTSSR